MRLRHRLLLLGSWGLGLGPGSGVLGSSTPLLRIPPRRTPRYHSSVNTGARNNIFASQFHRLRHQITTFPNFIAELAVIMGQLHCRGYPMPRLCRSLRRL
jgi:hypothetical protein